MPNYEQMYTELFQKVETAIKILGKAQISVEEIFMEAPEVLKMLDFDGFIEDFDEEEASEDLAANNIYPI